MKHSTRSTDEWARVVEEIIKGSSWRPLLRATLLVAACTLAAVAMAHVLILLR